MDAGAAGRVVRHLHDRDGASGTGGEIGLGAPAEYGLGQWQGEFAVEVVQLLGGVAAVAAAAHVPAQIGVEVVTAAPQRHVQHAVVLAALLLGGQFAVDLQAALAQAFTGLPQLDEGGVLADAQQSCGQGQLLGLDLGVPEQAAGGLRKPLERAGQ